MTTWHLIPPYSKILGKSVWENKKLKLSLFVINFQKSNSSRTILLKKQFLKELLFQKEELLMKKEKLPFYRGITILKGGITFQEGEIDFFEELLSCFFNTLLHKGICFC